MLSHKRPIEGSFKIEDVDNHIRRGDRRYFVISGEIIHDNVEASAMICKIAGQL